MTFKQFFFIPVYIALMAVTLVMLSDPSSLVIPFFWPWVAFQAWAMYFLAGCTLKGGIKVLLGYAGGAAASVAIFELMGLLAKSLHPAVALSIAVFLIVIIVISAERVPWFDFVPAWFVGAGIFFGVMQIYAFPELPAEAVTWAAEKTQWFKYCVAGKYLMVSCAIGLVYGVVTVLIRSKYEACLASKQEALPEADAPAEAPAEE